MYSFDNISLLRDGKRWFPVMGEIHYSRYPREFWKESLLKMKAGGVDIVSSYVIWIHHEEIENQYDFTGDRDLHAFVQTCKDCGIKLLLRIGPWSHGEVRNGGFPDWLLKKDFKVRTNNEKYFAVVEKWYTKIYEQVKEFLCSPESESNTIIGVQIENEFGHCGGLWDESGEDHMIRLQKIAKAVGFKVPLYTATGWGGARTGGMLPVMGGYCDAPWDPRTTQIEPSGNYIFTYERNDHNIGSDYGLGEGITFDTTKFPYLTAELGGGLQITKHRRTVATASDIGAVANVKLGSGVNLLGFYMYHGGTNPEGKLTTLQESKETGYPNDLPVKSYDFRAPVREFGQVSETLKELKLYAYFVHDFCSQICNAEAKIPEDNPLNPSDLEQLRYSFREDKNGSGFVFVNNYVRLQKMKEHKNVKLVTPSGVKFPEINIADKDYFFLPYNLKVQGAVIKSALCSPLCVLADGTTVFYKWNDSIPDSELFTFSQGTLESARILVLTRKQALNAWKTPDGKLIICPDEETSGGYIIADENNKLVYTGKGKLKFQAYPELNPIPAGFELVSYSENFSGKKLHLYEYNKTVPSVKSSLIRIDGEKTEGCYKIDLSKIMEDFKQQVANGITDDCFITIDYSGESAEIYSNGKLLLDNFYTGKKYSWEIGLKRFLNSNIDFENLQLKIKPLVKDMNIYFEEPPLTSDQKSLCSLNWIKAEFENRVKL